MKVYKLKIAGLMAAALIAFVPNLASAATAAGTNITNLATLTFGVGGTTQPTIGSSLGGNSVGGGSNTAFLVDRKINFTVATTDLAAVAATPGATAGSVMTFTITNNGNALQDFALSATSVITGAAARFAGLNDAINAGTVGVFVESGATIGFQSAQDTGLYVDELAAGAVVTVYIVSGTIPASAINGNVASYHLLATAHVAGAATTLGAVEAATGAGAETLAVEDVLFADGQGTDTANDALRDGKESAQSDYQVASAVITLSKVALIISDPVSGLLSAGNNPQAIPGASVQYTISIANAIGATASASLTTIADIIAATVTTVATTGIDTANYPVGWSLTDGTNTAKATLLADANAADGLDFGTTTGGSLTYAISTFLTTAAAATATPAGLPARAAGGELKPGETLTLNFQVTIN